MNTSLRILMLEDNPDDADLIRRLLERSGLHFNAIVATDESEFLSILDKNGFDVVLADNAIPQYSSLEALKVIKEKNPYIAFILVTGTVSEEFAVRIIQQGADDYILKTNLTRLPSAIHKAVESKNTQREKQQAQNEMMDLNEQLRHLAAHLNNVREEEQLRIAREIHDELGQMLTSIKMDISLADKKMEQSVPEAKEYLRQSMEIVDDLVKAIRRIASELRPAILDDLGLVAALEWQSREFEKLHKISCTFSSPSPDIQPSTNLVNGLYRIYQEALTNIARHAGASQVTSMIRRQGAEIILTVSDNGKGFNTEEAKNKKTLGLLGMKERALMMNGSLEIDSSPGRGTIIIVTVPMETFDAPGK